MKKVLFLLLFLLNLQVIADYIGVPLDDNALHAQNYNNEGYYDCYDDGEWYISSFPCEIEACVTTCPFCHESYPCRDSHLCPIPPAPSDDTWGNDYDDDDEEEDHEINHDFSGGGGSAGGSTSDNPELISMADFKSRPRVVKVGALPEALHKQTKNMECIVRAVSFLSELDGHDYDNAYNMLSSLAYQENKDYCEEGIYVEDAQRIFEPYCSIDSKDYNMWALEDYITQGIPVSIVTKEKEGYHMVVIIGYDLDSYYMAAGYSQVQVYPKYKLWYVDKMYLFNNIKIPYRCKRKTY